MKTIFNEHFKKSEGEIQDIWKDALFLFDANILLNFYRYSDESRDEFLQVLEDLKDKVRLPRQAASEFFKNRLGVINEQIVSYDKSNNQIENLKTSLRNDHGHPFLLKESLDNLFVTLDTTVNDLNKQKIKVVDRLLVDEILDRLGIIFENRVTPELKKEELEEIILEGISRYENKIPPGYKDQNKPNPDDTFEGKIAIFGDLIIWKQAISVSLAETTPIIFVTNDGKEDWWLEKYGKTIGPQPALISEFFQLTKNSILIYKPNQFLSYAKDHLKSKVSKSTIQEITRNSEVSLKIYLNEDLQNKYDTSLRSIESYSEALNPDRSETESQKGLRLNAMNKSIDSVLGRPHTFGDINSIENRSSMQLAKEHLEKQAQSLLRKIEISELIGERSEAIQEYSEKLKMVEKKIARVSKVITNLNSLI